MRAFHLSLIVWALMSTKAISEMSLPFAVGFFRTYDECKHARESSFQKQPGTFFYCEEHGMW